jgi:homoserine kinase type II
MSVFTPVSRNAASAWLAGHALGTLGELRGIAAGIENTNYFLDAGEQRFVLTLFEKLGPDELPFYLGLMAHLAARGIPCPEPRPDRAGALFSPLAGKPAALVSRLPGKPLDTPDATQCAQIGQVLAQIHLAGADFPLRLANPRGHAWWKATAPQVSPHLSPAEQQLLADELRFQALHRLQDLPGGVIHADLFRDNALFDGAKLTGVIDFYFACNDHWLYDVAITVNDWCLTQDGELDEARTLALLEAYHAVRPFTAIERGAWPVMLRAAALRFWLSRLYDLHFPRPGELTHAKDPTHFPRLLQRRAAAQSRLNRLWIR